MEGRLPRRRLGPPAPPKEATWEDRESVILTEEADGWEAAEESIVVEDDDEEYDEDDDLFHCTSCEEGWRPALLVPRSMVAGEATCEPLTSAGEIEALIAACEAESDEQQKARHILLTEHHTIAEPTGFDGVVVTFGAELNGFSSEGLWRAARLPTKYAVVRDMRELVSRTTRDPVWKAAMARELEVLAETCLARADKLSRLREARAAFENRLKDARKALELLKLEGKEDDIKARAERAAALEVARRIAQVDQIYADLIDVPEALEEAAVEETPAPAEYDDGEDAEAPLIDTTPIEGRFPAKAVRTRAPRRKLPSRIVTEHDDGYADDEVEDDDEDTDDEEEAETVVEEEEEPVPAADVEEETAEPPEPASALVNSILAMIFLRYPRRSIDTPEAHYAWCVNLQQSLVTQWRDELTVLPRRSDLLPAPDGL